MEEKKKNKIYITIGILIILVIIVISIVFNFTDNNLNNDTGTHDHGADDESSSIEYDSPTISINLDFLTTEIGVNGSNFVNNTIRDIIKNDNNKSSTLTVTIPSNSINRSNYFPYKVYNFNAEVSNNTIYNAQIAYEKEKYLGVLIQQIYPQNNNSSELYIAFFINPESSNYNRDKIIEDMEDWGKTIAVSSIIITTKDLY